MRGFQPSGFGPRDLTSGTTNDSLGGTLYWGASLEVQTPLYFLPKEVGIKVGAFVDAGSLWDYRGPTTWNVTGETLTVADSSCSSLVGGHQLYLGFAARSAALRFSLPAYEGKLRPHANLQIQRRHQVLTLAAV